MLQLSGHEACFICRGSYAFNEPVLSEDGNFSSSLTFSQIHEGWQGIPHGGIAMSLLLELADFVWQKKFARAITFPLAVDWRFADSVALGDEVEMEAFFQDEELVLQMRRRGSQKIYLGGRLRELGEATTSGLEVPLPEALLQAGPSHQPLGVYTNCFVCGRQRQAPGLQRRFFRCHAGKPGQEAIIVRFGGDDDQAIVKDLRQGSNTLHPGIIAALLDELCGWSGILAGDLFGFTVRLNLHLNRRPRLGEELFGFSPEPRRRGSGKRCFYFPTGVVYGYNQAGEIEEIATAEGQWLALEELRQQFYASYQREDLSQVRF